jgi:hypothetical protein
VVVLLLLHVLPVEPLYVPLDGYAVPFSTKLNFRFVELRLGAALANAVAAKEHGSVVFERLTETSCALVLMAFVIVR